MIYILLRNRRNIALLFILIIGTNIYWLLDERTKYPSSPVVTIPDIEYDIATEDQSKQNGTIIAGNESEHTSADVDQVHDGRNQTNDISPAGEISDKIDEIVKSTILKDLDSTKHNKTAAEIKKRDQHEDYDILLADITPPKISTVKLNATDNSLHPVYVNGCCGIGHRLSRVTPGLVYANRHGREARVWWGDVPWSALFNNTDFIKTTRRNKGWKAAGEQGLRFSDSIPNDWSSLERKKYDDTGTVFDMFHQRNDRFFDDPAIAAMQVSMRDSLTPLVLSYLSPIRAQLHKGAKDKSGHMSVCTHVRQGNNETGDWERKSWRHFDFEAVLNGINAVIRNLVESRNATTTSIYVASDSETVRQWFDANVPNNWGVIQPKKIMPKPKNGVWFGEQGSSTGAALNQTMKNEAMAEAIAEIFALGECDVLIIPNYSSFSYISISLMTARKNPVFFREDGGVQFREMSTFDGFEKKHDS